MKNLFTDHPSSIGETYFEHCCHALTFSWHMFVGSLACFLHAFFPFIFEKTGSDRLFKTLHKYINRMSRPETRVIELRECIEKKLGN